MHKITLCFLIFLSSFSFAQKKKAPVFVVGRVLNADDSVKIKEYFYEGLKEKSKENLAEASDYFKKVIEIDPSNHAALYELAGFHHSQNQEKEAEKYARDAVTVSGDNKWYWQLLGDIYKKTGNLEQLVLVFDALIRIDPDQEDYYYDKANALFIQNKNNDAEKVYNEIEKRFGRTGNLINARQRIYQKQGNTVKAASDLESLIQKNPNDTHNYLNLSEIYLKAGNIGKTIEILNKAKAINPNDPYVRLALADAYKAQGKNAEAFTELKQAFADQGLSIDAKVQIILSFFGEFKDDPKVRQKTAELGAIVTQIHPTDPKAFSVYGDVLYQDNQLEKAQKAYKKALELNNQVYQIWEQLIIIEISLKDYPAAIADGEEALTLFPNQVSLYIYTAMAYAQSGKHEKAVTYLKNATALEIEDQTVLSQIYASLGDSYNSLKKFKDSDLWFDKALQLNQDDVYVLNNYAYYLSLREENLDKASAMSIRSNELKPGNANFEDTYAWVLFKQKKYTEALLWIEKAIKSNKDNPTQLEHYGDILFNLGEHERALQQWKLAKTKGQKSEILERKIYEKKYIK